MAISNDPLYTPSPPTRGPHTEDGSSVVDMMQTELHSLSPSLTEITRLQLGVSGYGAVSTVHQTSGSLLFQEGGASVGNNIPLNIIFQTSDVVGQLNHNFVFDNGGGLTIPKGLIISALIAVAVPTNANAASAGVGLNQLYRDTADPSKIYVRTV